MHMFNTLYSWGSMTEFWNQFFFPNLVIQAETCLLDLFLSSLCFLTFIEHHFWIHKFIDLRYLWSFLCIQAPLSVEGWEEALHEIGKLSSETILSAKNAESLLQAVEHIPVLVIAGAEDSLVPLKSCQAMASKLKNSVRILFFSASIFSYVLHKTCVWKWIYEENKGCC